ncbi:condensation domain-containing protein [Streptomyces venezuelae]|uniref:condensation domain-containing protein n=1 Tax=Streptomyces venezuelae TaxID=54571 RepID=UPI00364BAFA8
MIQVNVEDVEFAPGHVYEWRMVVAEGDAPPSGVTSFNQEKHFSVAQEARAADDSLAMYIAATFELPGPVDREALGAALLYFVRRHDVLRSTFQQLVGALSCDVLAPDQVELRESDHGYAGSSDDVRDLLHRTFQGVDPLVWPMIRLGAVVRDDSATVWFTCDHAVADGLAMPIGVHDIAEAYLAYADGRAPELAEPGSYLAFSHEQRDRNATLDVDDPRLDRWKAFIAGTGSFFPRFPLDMGVEPGRMYPAVNETAALLTAEEMKGLETACQDVGGKIHMGLLAAVGVAVRKEGGPDVHRSLMPVSDRGNGPYAHSMGWFVNTMPIAFRVGEGQSFGAVMDDVRAALDDMRQHIDVPFVRAWELLAPDEYCAHHYWPYSVNWFSYLDFRRSPGAEFHLARDARMHVWMEGSYWYSFWLFRTDTGLYMNSIYAGTDRAKETAHALEGTLRRTLQNLAGDGVF